MRIKCVVTYNGAHFFGFQKQPELTTVQGELERALNHIHKYLGVKVFVSGSGRTDAGVHAKNQVIHFDTPITMDAAAWVRSMNGVLNQSIRVISAEHVSDDFHARYSAKSKTYHYYFHIGIPEDTVFDYQTVTYLSWEDIDIAKMKKAIKALEGKHDFTSFCRVDEHRNPNKEIFHTELVEISENRYCMVFHGTGFLRYQVRTMAGTIIDFGRSRGKCPTMEDVIESRDRNLAGLTAPPQGLYLMAVEY